MKNKKLTYILIPVVAVIWGFVIFQFFHQPSEANYAINYNTNLEENIKDTLIFEPLNLNYKDPFLQRKIIPTGPIRRANPNTSKPQSKLKVQNSKPKPAKEKIIWPQIKYGGTINQYKGLLKVNNQLFICTKNDTLPSNIIIESITSDSIQLQYQKTYRTIGKNKFE